MPWPSKVLFRTEIALGYAHDRKTTGSGLIRERHASFRCPARYWQLALRFQRDASHSMRANQCRKSLSTNPNEGLAHPI
jgi:hypothetical protein